MSDAVDPSASGRSKLPWARTSRTATTSTPSYQQQQQQHAVVSPLASSACKVAPAARRVVTSSSSAATRRQPDIDERQLRGTKKSPEVRDAAASRGDPRTKSNRTKPERVNSNQPSFVGREHAATRSTRSESRDPPVVDQTNASRVADWVQVSEPPSLDESRLIAGGFQRVGAPPRDRPSCGVRMTEMRAVRRQGGLGSSSDSSSTPTLNVADARSSHAVAARSASGHQPTTAGVVVRRPPPTGPVQSVEDRRRQRSSLDVGVTYVEALDPSPTRTPTTIVARRPDGLAVVQPSTVDLHHAVCDKQPSPLQLTSPDLVTPTDVDRRRGFNDDDGDGDSLSSSDDTCSTLTSVQSVSDDDDADVSDSADHDADEVSALRPRPAALRRPAGGARRRRGDPQLAASSPHLAMTTAGRGPDHDDDRSSTASSVQRINNFGKVTSAGGKPVLERSVVSPGGKSVASRNGPAPGNSQARQRTQQLPQSGRGVPDSRSSVGSVEPPSNRSSYKTHQRSDSAATDSSMSVFNSPDCLSPAVSDERFGPRSFASRPISIATPAADRRTPAGRQAPARSTLSSTRSTVDLARSPSIPKNISASGARGTQRAQQQQQPASHLTRMPMPRTNGCLLRAAVSTINVRSVAAETAASGSGKQTARRVASYDDAKSPPIVQAAPPAAAAAKTRNPTIRPTSSTPSNLLGMKVAAASRQRIPPAGRDPEPAAAAAATANRKQLTACKSNPVERTPRPVVDRPIVKSKTSPGGVVDETGSAVGAGARPTSLASFQTKRWHSSSVDVAATSTTQPSVGGSRVYANIPDTKISPAGRAAAVGKPTTKLQPGTALRNDKPTGSGKPGSGRSPDEVRRTHVRYVSDVSPPQHVTGIASPTQRVTSSSRDATSDKMAPRLVKPYSASRGYSAFDRQTDTASGTVGRQPVATVARQSGGNRLATTTSTNNDEVVTSKSTSVPPDDAENRPEVGQHAGVACAHASHVADSKQEAQPMSTASDQSKDHSSEIVSPSPIRDVELGPETGPTTSQNGDGLSGADRSSDFRSPKEPDEAERYVVTYESDNIVVLDSDPFVECMTPDVDFDVINSMATSVVAAAVAASKLEGPTDLDSADVTPPSDAASRSLPLSESGYDTWKTVRDKSAASTPEELEVTPGKTDQSPGKSDGNSIAAAVRLAEAAVGKSACSPAEEAEMTSLQQTVKRNRMFVGQIKIDESFVDVVQLIPSSPLCRSPTVSVVCDITWSTCVCATQPSVCFDAMCTSVLSDCEPEPEIVSPNVVCVGSDNVCNRSLTDIDETCVWKPLVAPATRPDVVTCGESAGSQLTGTGLSTSTDRSATHRDLLSRRSHCDVPDLVVVHPLTSINPGYTANSPSEFADAAAVVTTSSTDLKRNTGVDVDTFYENVCDELLENIEAEQSDLDTTSPTGPARSGGVDDCRTRASNLPEFTYSSVDAAASRRSDEVGVSCRPEAGEVVLRIPPRVTGKDVEAPPPPADNCKRALDELASTLGVPSVDPETVPVGPRASADCSPSSGRRRTAILGTRVLSSNARPKSGCWAAAASDEDVSSQGRSSCVAGVESPAVTPGDRGQFQAVTPSKTSMPVVDQDSLLSKGDAGHTPSAVELKMGAWLAEVTASAQPAAACPVAVKSSKKSAFRRLWKSTVSSVVKRNKQSD